MDANDEKPEFQNMPEIIDVLEVSQADHFMRLYEALWGLDERR